jgi:uncharacterized protein (UPF0332 family)
MEGSVIDLSRYRLETAKEDLKTAKDNLRDGNLRASVNRSYYAIFHALRSVLAFEQFDSGKHSGIIARINQNYVKTGIFDKTLSKVVDTAFRLREKADYQDFFVVSKEDAEAQIVKAEQVMTVIEAYVKKQWEKMDTP